MRLLLFLVLGLVFFNCNIKVHKTDEAFIEAISGNKYANPKYYKNALSNPKEIILNNSSFEANIESNYSQVPIYWGMCYDFKHSPPDVHSNTKRYFNVQQKASQGTKFLGFVIRADGSYEHITQQLSYPLLKDSSYRFQIDLSHSNELKSMVKETMQEEYFDIPAVFRVWANNSFCEYGQLLYTSKPIENINWETYSIEFTMEETYDHFLIEAYFDEENHEDYYYGNLMLDNLSPIYLIPSSN